MAIAKKPNVTDVPTQFEKTFEIFANEQAAEIEAVRAVLQSFLVNILSSHPEGAMLFDNLRTETLKRLADDSTLAGADKQAVRKAEFVHLRATQIFDEVAPAFGLGQTDQPKRSN
jgi:hypothetical protein